VKLAWQTLQRKLVIVCVFSVFHYVYSGAKENNTLLINFIQPMCYMLRTFITACTRWSKKAELVHIFACIL